MWDAPPPYEDNNPFAQPYQSDRFAYDTRWGRYFPSVCLIRWYLSVPQQPSAWQRGRPRPDAP